MISAQGRNAADDIKGKILLARMRALLYMHLKKYLITTLSLFSHQIVLFCLST